MELIEKAGLTPEILADAKKRSAAIDEFNAKAGGLRALMRGGKLTPARTHEIPSNVSPPDGVRYLKYAASGKRIPIIFAAGRATRMKLPPYFDKLGIAGLTGRLLNALQAGTAKDEEYQTMVNTASNGEGRGPQDMSFIMRILLQYRHDAERLIAAYPDSGVSLKDWIRNAKFAVVTNGENRTSAALQMASIGFAGLLPENIFVIVQPEEGGEEVLSDGATRPYTKEVWPEGHGKPFIDMQADAHAAFGVNTRGHLIPLNKTLVQKFRDTGVERAVFAQVNDLHLLHDMAHIERWLAADTLIQKGAEMVIEMVANGLKQKGGGIFDSGSGHVVLRDTIAMKSPDLDVYAIPESLSRMFYELTVSGIAKLTSDTLPAYITERTGSHGKPVLTREYYSGDASSVLKTDAIQQKGFELFTFKMRERIPTALEAIRMQDAQPGYFNIFKRN